MSDSTKLEAVLTQVRADRKAMEEVARTSGKLVRELPEAIRNLREAVADFGMAISLSPAPRNDYDEGHCAEAIKNKAETEEKIKRYEALLPEAQGHLAEAERFLADSEDVLAKDTS